MNLRKMEPKPSKTSGFTESSSSRTVYLLRRAAGGLLLIGIIMFFVDNFSIWLNIGFIVAGVLTWFLAGWLEGRRRRKNAVECDENGNAVKKVL